MSGRPSILRSAALLCAAHARRVLLRRNPFWADGMEQEAHHIDEDWSALQWALGCVCASYIEVLKAERFFVPFVARLFLAAICLREALNGLDWMIAMLECHLYDQPHGVPYPVALMFVYHHFLFTPATNTGFPCIQIDPVPLWWRAIQAGVGSLYLAAGLRVVQRRASAIPLFFAALVAAPLAHAVAITVPGIGSNNPHWYWTDWYSKDSDFWYQLVVQEASVTSWRLIVCLCIGLVFSVDYKRKIAR
jgi:hypothetical protein